jgi:hypothetical protein
VSVCLRACVWLVGVQATSKLQPRYQVDGLGPNQPALVFDGVQTFLQSSAASLPAEATIIAVFRDDGSTGGNSGYVCCSGIVYYGGSDYGVSTIPATGGVDDDDGHAEAGTPEVVKADYNGSPTQGTLNVRGRVVSGTVVYNGGAVDLYAQGCYQNRADLSLLPGSGVMVGTRNNQYGRCVSFCVRTYTGWVVQGGSVVKSVYVDVCMCEAVSLPLCPIVPLWPRVTPRLPSHGHRYFKGAIGEVIVYPRALNSSELSTIQGYLEAAWPAMAPKHCASPPTPAYQLSQMYAVTRYTQAIQSRGTLVRVVVV